MEIKTEKIEMGELVLPCFDLDETLEFFTEQLGFRVVAVFPADNPCVAVVSGYGLRLRLEKTDRKELVNKDIYLRLNCSSPPEVAVGRTEINAPNGIKIKFVGLDSPLIIPENKPSFVLSQLSDNSEWSMGRAGMRYRDLIPDRQGGRFIASHIHIPDGGPVPDYVHFHKIRFQMIYCYKGWAKLVYEDQGKPFLFEAGDCVLQPPEIRHRVLESSDNLEVVEIASPAEHETYADQNLELPNKQFDPERIFNGQRFVRSVSREAIWKNWRLPGFECRDTGIGKATSGLAGVKIVRPVSAQVSGFIQHKAEFVFLFILQGRVSFYLEREYSLRAGDSLVVPSDTKYGFLTVSEDLEMLEVTLPAELKTVQIIQLPDRRCGG